MIKITSNAAEQIRLSAQQGKTERLPLRIAVTQKADKSLHYGMGFDDGKDEDIKLSVDDIELVVSPESAEFLKDATLDFVELEPGKHQFIFMNPNDPEYIPPAE